MNKKALIAIGILVLVIGGAVFWMLRQDTSTQQTSESPTANTATTEPANNTTDIATTPTAGETVITYSNGGYSPSSVTVKSGDTVVIKNTSTRNMQFDSDPHPAHTINPELNVDEVAPGQSQSFVVDTTGTFGYHNHLNSSQKGTIIVE